MTTKTRILSVVGARPQFVKAAAVSAAFQKLLDAEEILIHTGQHFDSNMSDTFFEELGIPHPAKNLQISGGTHASMTGRQLIALEAEMLHYKPDCVLLYGDTNSTLAGGLAAAKLSIPVAHVEAGLRSFNRKMPEELNRVLVDHLSDSLFCPTENSVKNLTAEGIDSGSIYNVGDVMLDVYRRMTRQLPTDLSVSEKYGLSEDFAVLTIHRQESTDPAGNLRSIVRAIEKISHEMSVLFPLHPRTRNVLKSEGLLESLSKSVTICDPLGFVDMASAVSQCSLVITDSGGLQKEAYFSAKPCLTIRTETEWVELVEAGWNVLAGEISEEAISAGFSKIRAAKPIGAQQNLYGDGQAAEKIAKIVMTRSSLRN